MVLPLGVETWGWGYVQIRVDCSYWFPLDPTCRFDYHGDTAPQPAFDSAYGSPHEGT